MRDKISIDRANLLHPSVRAECIACIDKAEAQFPPNIAIRIVQGLRTIDEQNALYAKGRTKPGKIVTNARGGKSYHNYGLAVDFSIMYDKDGNGSFEVLSWDTAKDGDDDGLKDWLEVVKVFEEAGWFWGGRFSKLKDAPHLQRTFGYTIATLLAKYKKKEFILGTQYVII